MSVKKVLFLGFFLAFLIFSLNGEVQAQATPGGIMNSFIDQTNGWWSVLQGKAMKIFGLALTLEVCLFGVRMALQRGDPAEIFGQFVMLLLFAGFIAAVIMNYEEWAKAIAIEGLGKDVIGDLTGKSYGIDQPFRVAEYLWTVSSEVSNKVSLSALPQVMVYMAAVFLMVIVMFILCAMMILIKCEFYILANVGVLLIGLGGSKIFKEYAFSVMRYVLSVALKIFVLQLVANIGFTMISADSITSSVTIVGDQATVAWPTVFLLLAKTCILLVLAKSLPDACAGIINGAHVSGGNPLAQMATRVGRTAMAGAGAALTGGAGAVMALKNAHTVARAGGSQGLAGTVGGMASAINDARKQTAASKPGSMQSALMSMASRAKAGHKMDS